ncbi:RAN1-like protein kinase [Paraphaeosphaeria sporulosa]
MDFVRRKTRLGQILAGRLHLTGNLGVGAYGVVYTAVDIQTNTPYAVKALNKLGLEPRQRKFQQREIQLHYQASAHPNVLSLVKIMDVPDCTCVVIEYCPEGDLFSNITKQGKDLKPENVLVTDNGMTCKLADFGLATNDPSRLISDAARPHTCRLTAAPKADSRYASAPNDVWSLGVILVNLTCGRNRWKRASYEDRTFRAYMKDPNFLKSILPNSPELDSILRRIFEFNPVKRITIPELRELIMRCPRFSATKSGAPTPMASPPFPPVDYVQEASYYQAIPPAAALPGLVYSPSVFELPSTQHFMSSRSSNSDNEAVFSSCSSASSAPSTSSFTHVHPAQKPSVRQSTYVSQPPASGWFHNFFQAANMVKHVSFQPPMMAPVHVYQMV